MRGKTKIEYIYNDFGACIGQRVVMVPPVDFGFSGNFDYEEYENQAAYGYDHSAFAPDIGDK